MPTFDTDECSSLWDDDSLPELSLMKLMALSRLICCSALREEVAGSTAMHG